MGGARPMEQRAPAADGSRRADASPKQHSYGRTVGITYAHCHATGAPAASGSGDAGGGTSAGGDHALTRCDVNVRANRHSLTCPNVNASANGYRPTYPNINVGTAGHSHATGCVCGGAA